MYFVSFLMFFPPPVSPLTLFQVCLPLDCPAGLFAVLFGVWVRGVFPGVPSLPPLLSSCSPQPPLHCCLENSLPSFPCVWEGGRRRGVCSVSVGCEPACVCVLPSVTPSARRPPTLLALLSGCPRQPASSCSWFLNPVPAWLASDLSPVILFSWQTARSNSR
ncbi:hypothetical protein FKM82_019836 [Ascaphus truei]